MSVQNVYVSLGLPSAFLAMTAWKLYTSWPVMNENSLAYVLRAPVTSSVWSYWRWTLMAAIGSDWKSAVTRTDTSRIWKYGVLRSASTVRFLTSSADMMSSSDRLGFFVTGTFL